jgi:hypothetical protein
MILDFSKPTDSGLDLRPKQFIDNATSHDLSTLGSNLVARGQESSPPGLHLTARADSSGRSNRMSGLSSEGRSLALPPRSGSTSTSQGRGFGSSALATDNSRGRDPSRNPLSRSASMSSSRGSSISPQRSASLMSGSGRVQTPQYESLTGYSSSPFRSNSRSGPQRSATMSGSGSGFVPPSLSGSTSGSRYPDSRYRSPSRSSSESSSGSPERFSSLTGYSPRPLDPVQGQAHSDPAQCRVQETALSSHPYPVHGIRIPDTDPVQGPVPWVRLAAHRALAP